MVWSGPGDWPLHRLKVHIPVAAMAYLCDADTAASASGGGVALKGTIQASRGMQFVMAGGLKAGYTPPIFQDVEPHRHLLLQQLRSRQALPFDCQDYCGLVGALEPSVIRTDMWIPFPGPLRTLRVRHMYLPTVGGLPCLQPRPCLMLTPRR